MNKHTLARGFTLIEILVVITIIGILSTVIYANFTEARNESKNKAFQVEMKETQLALELYKAQNGKYPPGGTGPSWGFCGSTYGGVTLSTTGDGGCGPTLVINGLVPDFISSLPDPKASANSHCGLAYLVATDQSYYKLIAQVCHSDGSSPVTEDSEFAVCPASCGGSCGGNAELLTALAPAFVGMSQDDIDQLVGAFVNQSYAIYSKGGECL